MEEFATKAADSSKCTQLTFLQNRISLHGSRLWQLPLTYYGLIVLAISATNGKANPNADTWNTGTSMVFGSMTVLGIILFCCMLGALEGYHRAGKHMIRLENELGLVASTRTRKSHYVPYFCLITLGIVVSIIAFFELSW